MITVAKSGLTLTASSEDIDALHLDFVHDHFIRLPGLLSDELLEEFYSQITTAKWEERIHENIGLETCLSDAGIVALINFLINDQDLFMLLEKITGSHPIRSFAGRAYRMVPNSGHYDSWHNDVGKNRLLALSINLGKEPYEGGVLQIRKRTSDKLLAEVPNTGFGNAILFRIAEDLEHRVTNIEGNVPKTAFAGWFQSEPDFWATLVGKSS